MPRGNPIELIERTGEPPLIAFSIDASLAREPVRHRHARGQLCSIRGGVAVVYTGRGSWVMPPGMAGWIPPGLLHSAHWHGPVSGWSVYVSPRACEPLPREPRVVRMSRVLEAIVERATGWALGEALGPEQSRLAAVAIDELRTAPEEAALRVPMPRDRQLAAIARALLAKPADARGLAALASAAGLSERTLTRRFREETGMSFTQWRVQARLSRALELLSQGEAVADVAFSVGYENVSAFIAMFKRTLGTTPARCFSPPRAGP